MTIGEAHAVLGVRPVVREGPVRGIEEIEAVGSAHPQAASGVLQERAHLVVRQAPRDIRLVAEVPESSARREPIEAAGRGPHPDRSEVVLEDGAHLRLAQARCRRRVRDEVHEGVRAGVEPVEAPVGADPQPTGAIDGERVDAIVDEASRRTGVVDETRERAGRDLQAVQPRVARSDPERALLRREGERAHVLGRERLRAHDPIARPLPAGETSSGRDPEVARGVLGQVPDEARGQRGGVGYVAPVDLEADPVVAVEAVLRGEPHVALPVLEDAVDARLRQALLEGEAIEADRTLRRRQRPRRDEQHQGQQQSGETRVDAYARGAAAAGSRARDARFSSHLSPHGQCD